MGIRNSSTLIANVAECVQVNLTIFANLLAVVMILPAQKTTPLFYFTGKMGNYDWTHVFDLLLKTTFILYLNKKQIVDTQVHIEQQFSVNSLTDTITSYRLQLKQLLYLILKSFKGTRRI